MPDDWEPVAQEDWAPVKPKRIGISDVASMAWNDIKRTAANVAGAVHSGVTLPRDVITGAAQLPSSGAVPGSVEFGDPRSAGGRVADMAMLATPLSPAARAGEAAIPGAMKATVTEAAPKPTIAGTFDAATQGFNAAKNMGVDISPQPIVEMANKIERNLWNKGIHEEHAPATYATLAKLRNPPEGAIVTISDLHNLRQAFGNAAGSAAHPKDALAGSIGKETLDEFLSAIPAKDVLAGDAAGASTTLKDAIDNWAAASRAGDVDARLTRAERQAAKSGSGTNLDNATRQKISAVLDVPGRTRGWSPEEIAQAETVVRGTPAANVARKIGKLGFNDGLSLMLHAGATIPTGGANIPIGVAGTVSRKIAEALTSKQANKLGDMLLSRSPYAASLPETITRGMTGGEQGMRAARMRSIAELLNAQGQR